MASRTQTNFRRASIAGLGAAMLLVGCSRTANDVQPPAGAKVAEQPAPVAPESVTHIETGKQLMAEGRYAEAIDHFTRALQAGGDAPPVAGTNLLEADVYLQRGLAFMKSGFPDTAVEDFTEVISLAPKHGPAFQHRGEAQLLLGDSYNALRDSTEAIRLDSHNAQAYRTRGEVYVIRGQFERAAADLQQAIALDASLADALRPQLADVYVRWSDELLEEGDAAAAGEQLAKAAAIDPAAATRAEAARAADEAVEQTAAKPVVDDAAPKLAAGNAHLAEGEHDEALMEFSGAIALNPKSIEAYLRRGETLLAMGFPDTALEDFRQVIRLGGESPELYRLQAKAFLKLGSPHRAALAATDALHLDPAQAPAYAARGEAYLQLERWDRALADLREAIRRDGALADQLAPALERAQRRLDDAQATAAGAGDDEASVEEVPAA